MKVVNKKKAKKKDDHKFSRLILPGFDLVLIQTKTEHNPSRRGYPTLHPSLRILVRQPSPGQTRKTEELTQKRRLRRYGEAYLTGGFRAPVSQISRRFIKNPLFSNIYSINKTKTKLTKIIKQYINTNILPIYISNKFINYFSLKQI